MLSSFNGIVIKLSCHVDRRKELDTFFLDGDDVPVSSSTKRNLTTEKISFLVLIGYRK